MQFIPTTVTAVQKIKSTAKAVSRTTDISHTKALEHVSKEHGYEGWYHVQQCQKLTAAQKHSATVMTREQAALAYFDYLSVQPRSPVQLNTVEGEVFHDVTIEGQRFVAKVMSTGDIHLFKLRSGFDIDYAPSIQIGPASIRKVDASGIQSALPSEFSQTTADMLNPRPYGAWWICKYDDSQRRIDLGAMSEHGRNAFAYEFGLPIIPHSNLPKPTDPWYRFANGNEDTLFYICPSYQALLAWAVLYPKRAREASANAIHLKNWLKPTI